MSTPKGGWENLWIAQAHSLGAGMVWHGGRSELREAEMKFRPRICVAHCSGVWVLCVWPCKRGNGIIF
jgi:hypothetical protein